MKTNKQTMVSIPKVTLNALKNMLFNNENGIDLSNIVNDLTINDEQKDLVAINVALVHKGVEIDIDKTTRYEHDYGNYIRVYEYNGFSLIHGVVKTNSYQVQWNGTELVRTDDKIYSNGYGLEQWERMTTDVNEILKRI